MMKKLFLIALTSFCTVCVVCAVSGQQVVRGDRMADFSTVNLTGKISAELIPADENKIEITMHDAEINRLEWGVKDGTLRIKLKTALNTSPPGRATAKIHYKDLRTISLNEAEAVAHEAIAGNLLTVELSGGAKMTARIEALDLEVKATNASVAQFEGTAKYLTLRTSMKSKVDARKLESVDAEVNAMSNTEVYVKATERLAAEASTASTIFYLGNPVILKKTEKLGSTIHNVDAQGNSEGR